MEIEKQSTKPIPLRKISSLDSSDLFSTMDEKQRVLQSKRTQIDIPSYPKTKKYRSNTVRRIYARFRYFAALVKQKARAVDYPLIVVLVVNNRCNWNCTYCFGDYPNRRDLDYTTDEIKFLVDELYGMGVRYFNVHGGETFLRNDLGEICDYIKNKGAYLCIITNGSLLEQKLESVRGVDNLTISLDGRPENNDMSRGKGSFDKALSAIELAVAEKIPLRVQATLTRHTMHDIEFMAKLAQEKNFHLQFSILFKPLKQARDAQMSNEEIRSCIREIQHYRDIGYPVFTSDKVLDATFHWPYDFNEKHHISEAEIPDSYRKQHIPCYYSRTKFTVEADGYVYPCFLTTDGSFKPISWREHGVAAAIKHVQEHNTCKACPAMTQNDHNLLLGMNLPQVAYLVRDQLKEVFHIRNRLKK